MSRRPIDPGDEDLAAPAWTDADDSGIAVDVAYDADAPAKRSTRRDAPKRQSLPLRLALGGGVVFVVGLLITAGAKSYRDLQIVRQREAHLGARIGAAEDRLEDLQHRLELLRYDPATLERLAREELGLVSPEDIVFVLPPAPDPPPASTPAAETPAADGR
jgi:cell division protein FtsB